MQTTGGKKSAILGSIIQRPAGWEKLRGMLFLWLLPILLLLGSGFGETVLARVIYVDVNATGARTGASWADAYAIFERAIDESEAGDELWVAQGIYLPYGGGSADEEDYFKLKNAVAVYGGFSGMETLREERDPAAYPTIFSGNIGNPDNNTDNCLRVFYLREGLGLDTSTILDGVTISDAYGYSDYHGGMVIDGGSPTLTNCIFRDNRSEGGGGLYNEGGSPVLSDCQFLNNVVVGGTGGGMLSWKGSPVVTHCRFESNTAAAGGGLAMKYSPQAVVSSTLFIDNMAENVGGGALVSGEVSLTDCRFDGNHAAKGAGAAVADGAPQINRCLFTDNIVDSGSWGGGGIYVTNNAAPAITNCIFSGNNGMAGGGAIAATYQADVSVGVCTFYSNYALSGQGVFATDEASVSIANSILWGNNGAGATQVTTSLSGTVTVTYSDIDQNGFDGVNGNIRQAPELTDPANDDFQLTDTSPCIDGGFPNILLDPFATCFYGNYRYLDGDLDGTARIDMGAHEYIPQVWVDDDWSDASVGDVVEGHIFGTNAFDTVQGGLDAVTGPAVVHVAAGTYNEHIMLENGVRVEGAGPKVTILDGIGLHGNVVTVQNVNGTTIFEGFTVQGGTRTTTATQGTGMNLIDSSPAVRNCHFLNNETVALQNSNSSPQINDCVFRSNSGSGMFNLNDSNPVVTDCLFEANNATGMRNVDSSPELIRCDFIDNYTADAVAPQGGALYNGNANPRISDCRFQDNVLDNGVGGMAGAGGAIYNLSSSPEIQDCTFTGNGAASGGAIFNINSSPVINDSAFTNNRSDIHDDDEGGAITNYSGGSLTLTNCIFTSNSGFKGGAIYISLSDAGAPPTTITNCIFNGNSAMCHGGAIFSQFDGGAMQVVNSVFYNNDPDSDDDSTGLGGAIYNDRADVTLVNTIAWGDSDSEIYDLNIAMTVKAHYSNIQGGFGEAVDLNLDTDPLFIDPDAGDFHLEIHSPCVDAGTSDAAYNVPDTDLAGAIRPLGLSHDMGAYETASAQKISVFPDIIEFGPVVLTDPVESYLTIENEGFATLTVTELTLGIGDVFTISPVTLPLELAGGELINAAINFTPVSLGGVMDTLTIISDDAQNPAITITLTGQGAEPAYFITASSTEGGHLSPEGSLGAADGGSRSFDVVPDEGFVIDDVLVDGLSVGAVESYTFSDITSDHTIHAVFEAIVPVITTTAGSGGSFNLQGSIQVTYGEDLTIDVIPDYGYAVAAVRVDGVGVGPVTSYTFTHVTEDHTIEADFTIATYTVEAEAGPGGSITPNGTLTLDHSDNVTFNIMAYLGYEIVDVQVNGLSMGPLSTFTISNIAADTHINALFAVRTFTVTAQAGAGGTISPEGVNIVDYDGEITFTMTADDCRVLESVIIDGEYHAPVESYSLANVTRDHNITAVFVPAIELLTPLGDEVYVSGQSIPVQWRVNGEGIYLNLSWSWEGETTRTFIYTATGDDFHVGSTSFTAPAVTGTRRLIVEARTNNDAVTLCTVASGPLVIIEDTDQQAIWLQAPQPINTTALSVTEGDALTITWETNGCNDIGPIAVRLSTDGGVTYPTTIANYFGCAGQSFDWPVELPDGVAPPVQANIRVVWGALFSSTIHSFTIAEPGGANHPPVAVVANDTLTVVENTLVTLSGADSYDPDGDGLIFRWERVDTTSWEFPVSGNMTHTATFTAPDISHGYTDLVFRLTIWDEHGLRDQAVVSVRVTMEAPQITEITGERAGWFHAPVSIAGSNLSGCKIAMRREGSTIYQAVDTIPGIAEYNPAYIFFLPDLTPDADYAIRVTNDNGLDETGFIYHVQPVPYQWDWGYGFENPGDVDISWANFEDTYGHDAVTWGAVCCEWDNGSCVRACHDPLAQLIFDKFNQYAGGLGLCYGMSVSSMKYAYGDYDLPGDAPGSDAIRDLSFTGVTADRIQQDHISQISAEALAYLKTHAFDLPGDTVRQIQTDLAEGRYGVLSIIDDILAMEILSDLQGHAVIPVHVEEIASNQWRVYVYDSNREEASYYRELLDTPQYPVITQWDHYPYVAVHEYDDGTGQWQWEHGPGNIWESSGIAITAGVGNAAAETIFHGLVYIPSEIAVRDNYTLPSSLEGISMILGGDARMGISDPDGHTTGYNAEGVLEFNVPNALPVVPLTGSTLSGFQYYLLDTGPAYSVSVYGTGETGAYDFQAFCKGTHFAVSDLDAPATGLVDTLVLDTTTLSLTLQGRQAIRPFSATLVKEIQDNGITTARRSFEVENALVVGNRQTKLYLTEPGDGIVYENHSDQPVTINLKLGLNKLSPQPEPPDIQVKALATDSADQGGLLEVDAITIPPRRKVTIRPDSWEDLTSTQLSTQETDIDGDGTTSPADDGGNGGGGGGGGCFLDTLGRK